MYYKTHLSTWYSVRHSHRGSKQQHFSPAARLLWRSVLSSRWIVGLFFPPHSVLDNISHDEVIKFNNIWSGEKSITGKIVRLGNGSLIIHTTFLTYQHTYVLRIKKMRFFQEFQHFHINIQLQFDYQESKFHWIRSHLFYDKRW